MPEKFITLSLDPMYSPLHEIIGDLISKERYAVTSCFAKKIYLKNYTFILATTLINQYAEKIHPDTLVKIRSLKSYHHAYTNKIEGRELNQTELLYMATFYQALHRFIQEKQINLVLLHNDTRWYHAIAILLCKELNLQYLVTEQGLIRPNTTVIDNRGANAFSSLATIDFTQILPADDGVKKFNPKQTHDSWISMSVFFCFITLFTAERLIGKNRTILRYMHNNYSLKKYAKRLANRLMKSKKTSGIPVFSSLRPKSVLLLLQLENDSQLLLHSEFSDNQQLIDQVYQQCQQSGFCLAVKKHPLDLNHYQLGEHSYWVDGNIEQLATHATTVVTINSSATVDVLKTQTPLLLLGESPYHHAGVAQTITMDALSQQLTTPDSIDVQQRTLFLQFLANQYLLQGAGYSFNTDLLQQKLTGLLHD
jgi:capsular polysaccharide export protein